jgi:diguanylate cyclase (GGDEF)-like protein
VPDWKAISDELNFMSAPARATTSIERTGRRDQGRILIVADDPSGTTYTPALESAGFAVVGVAGGLAALVALRRTRPHVVIADTGLKGISVDELARMLAQAQDGVPLVLVGAAEASPARLGAALGAGAFDYVQMPAHPELLLARAAQLVGLRQTMERLRAEADRDYLTGLLNRRRFRAALGQEVERWRRYRVPCALLLVDIDHLKLINDAHGHSAGDVVIRHIASSLTQLSRDNDTAARLGGEEFALLLAGTDDVKALAAAERVRHVVSAGPLEGIGTVTVSLGLAACPAHATSERSLYAASDAALYNAKHEGRDRTAVAALVSPIQADLP